MNNDDSQQLQQQLQDAVSDKTPLKIVGGDSKAFYGNPVRGETVSTRQHQGIIDYESTELVLTARSGTPLQEIDEALAKHNQYLPFEPPHFGEHATLGGTIACGFSGPQRPYAGAARDFVLGCKLLTGKADIAQFGGQVMKNVAGYDVSRLMTGALGTLGILLEISLKVLPRPAQTLTLVQQLDATAAIERMNQLAGQAIPLSAACYDGEQLWLRLSGANAAVASAKQHLGGEQQDNHFWTQLREQQLAFFDSPLPLWRLSVPSDTSPPALNGRYLIDWGGAQYWLLSEEPAEKIQTYAAELGGHATLFRSSDKPDGVFHPLDSQLRKLHLNLKMSFDPYGLLNYGKMYADI